MVLQRWKQQNQNHWNGVFVNDNAEFLHLDNESVEDVFSENYKVHLEDTESEWQRTWWCKKRTLWQIL